MNINYKTKLNVYAFFQFRFYIFILVSICVEQKLILILFDNNLFNHKFILFYLIEFLNLLELKMVKYEFLVVLFMLSAKTLLANKIFKSLEGKLRKIN